MAFSLDTWSTLLISFQCGGVATSLSNAEQIYFLMFSTACSHNLFLSTLHHPELVAMGKNVDWSPQQTAEDTPINLSVFNPHYLTHEQDPEKRTATHPQPRGSFPPFSSLERWPYAWSCYFLFQQFTLSCKSLKCKLRSWFNEANRTTSPPISRDDILRPQNPTSSTSWLHLKMMNRTGDRRQSWWSPVPLGMSLTYC